MKRVLSLLLCAALLVGCSDPTPVKNAQADAARAAANALDFHGTNAEIGNIKRRLELTARPDLIGSIKLISQNGQVVATYPVLGKVTSGSKRLTNPEVWNGQAMEAAPNDEGTYGSSDAYTYFFTPDGQYVQWNGTYLYQANAGQANPEHPDHQPNAVQDGK